MNTLKLFSPATLGHLKLSNHIVMAPMTRSRAIGNVPNAVMATYYGQRASAGLIVTEGTSPSANGLGYARIPGIFSDAQVDGWKLVTKAVHDKGGKIFVQLMHTGRVSHPLNLPAGAEVLAPSAIAPAITKMWTDAEGMKDIPVPRAFSLDEVKAVIAEYATAAKNAVKAGFDGIELHGANGYLIEQFLSPASNQRTDEYGGSVKARAKFLLDVAEAAIAAIGKDKVGIRLSPYGVSNDMPHYAEIDETYSYVAEQLNALGVLYIHLVDHSSMGAPAVPKEIVTKIRAAFKSTLIFCGGYDKAKAEAALQSSVADLVAFGRPFIANPDLTYRLKADAALAQPNSNMFYTAGEQGYSDYPALEKATATA
jgi:N-ethylmaleimide reductase